MAKSKKILEGSLKDLKRRNSSGLLRLSVNASLADVSALPGVASAKAVDGAFVLALAPGVAQKDFLKRALDTYTVDAFSQKEPDLEEIYIDAVRSAGMEETRTIE